MNPVSHLTSDPSVLLLNEIDILLAQMRLVELYVKQAQASAANHAVILQQQHQAEMARIRAELADKDRSAQQHTAAQIADLTAQLTDKQRSLNQSVTEIGELRRQLEQKTLELNQTQTSWDVVEKQYKDQLAALGHGSDDRETTTSIRSDVAVNAPQPARIEAVPNARVKIAVHTDANSPQSRRWQSRFAAQRRWKV